MTRLTSEYCSFTGIAASTISAVSMSASVLTYSGVSSVVTLVSAPISVPLGLVPLSEGRQVLLTLLSTDQLCQILSCSHLWWVFCCDTRFTYLCHLRGYKTLLSSCVRFCVTLGPVSAPMLLCHSQRGQVLLTLLSTDQLT